MLPPPLDELMLPSDHSERGSDSDLHDVREAIHNAMDSVNRWVFMQGHITWQVIQS